MSYCLFLLISALNDTPQLVERLLWLCFLLGNIIIVSTIVSFFLGFEFSFQLSDIFSIGMRVSKFVGTRASLTGTMPVPKAIACVLNDTIFCGLALLCTRTRRDARVLILMSLLGMLFIHLLTLSRIEAMGLVFGWLTFVHLNPQWRGTRIRQHLWMALATLGVIVALVVFLSTFYNLNELMARSLSQEESLRGYRFSAAQGRLDHLWYAIISIWETGGLGAGAAGIMEGLDPTIFVQSPTLYFSFLTDHGYGVLSLILMAWIMINVFMELRWAYQNCPDPRFKIIVAAVCSSLVVFATAGIADHVYYNWEMWVLLGLAVATVKSVRYLIKNQNDPSPPFRLSKLP